MNRPSVYSTTSARTQGICPKCGYRLSNFRTSARCFNCDYTERGSDGPWSTGATDQSLIWHAESIWDRADPFFQNEHKYRHAYEYLKQRRIFDLAVTCDQLRMAWGLNRVLNIRAYGSLLVGRIWHVRKGFVGIHVTRIEWNGWECERDERRTMGSCRGGAVWFGTVTPDTELVVGEGIETTLSAMILWGAKAGAATLGTAGLESLVLPQAARRVVIAADNDGPEPPHKVGIGLRAARKARWLWQAEDPTIDVEIKLAPPPKPSEQKLE